VLRTLDRRRQNLIPSGIETSLNEENLTQSASDELETANDELQWVKADRECEIVRLKGELAELYELLIVDHRERKFVATAPTEVNVQAQAPLRRSSNCRLETASVSRSGRVRCHLILSECDRGSENVIMGEIAPFADGT
jgi:hypothetical protein